MNKRKPIFTGSRHAFMIVLVLVVCLLAQLADVAPVQAATNVPTQKSPIGTISFTKPSYKWTLVTGATKYHLEIYRGTTRIFTSVYLGSACGTVCSFKPDKTLGYNVAYKWRVRAMKYGTWKPWSVFKTFTVSGFNSTFNANSNGWTVVDGPWWRTSTGWYRTGGSEGNVVSTVRQYSYSTLDYQVRLRRSGTECDNCANYLYIRGTVQPIDTQYQLWYNAYIFDFTNSQQFLIIKKVNGVASLVQDWKVSTAIVPYGWNTLRVTAKGTALRFYINGKLVWSGSNAALTTGRVGIGMFRSGETSPKLDVDWAKLSTYVPAADVLEDLFQDETDLGVVVDEAYMNLAPAP